MNLIAVIKIRNICFVSTVQFLLVVIIVVMQINSLKKLTKYGLEYCDIYLFDSNIHHPNSIEKDFFIDAQGEKI